MANALLFGWLFLGQPPVFGCLLQIAYFLPMQFYGWWVWKKAGPRHADDLPVTRLALGRLRFMWSPIAAASVGWGS